MTSSTLKRQQWVSTRSAIENAQIKLHYPTANSIHSWQVKYEKYGGLKPYQIIRNLYWKLFIDYCDEEGKYCVVSFPIKNNPMANLLKKFREDLITPITRNEKNNQTEQIPSPVF